MIDNYIWENKFKKQKKLKKMHTAMNPQNEICVVPDSLKAR
jgi:hypothetical protein